MMVIMALVTTAMTAPIMEFLWFRHQAKKNKKAAEVHLTENYLTLTFDDNPDAQNLNDDIVQEGDHNSAMVGVTVEKDVTLASPAAAAVGVSSV
jgi:hypothetical protein